MTSSWAFAPYDGIWFLGFNLHKDVFSEKSGRDVREAVAEAISLTKISKIVGSAELPAGYIPAGLAGAMKSGPSANLAGARALLEKDGIRPSDPRLKKLSMLHTDGRETVLIARSIESDLKKLGITVTRVVIPFAQQERWREELESGRHHMFLMGYKDEGGYDNFGAAPASSEAKAYVPNPVAILRPLFGSRGEANFTFFRNAEFDALMEKADEPGSLPASREAILQQTNEILVRERPAVVLFYIPRI